MIKRIFCLVACVGGVLWGAQSAHALPPTGFTQPRATFSLGLESFDAKLGAFGAASDVGMGIFAETSLQLKGYFGAAVRFGSARAFTKKDFLPFDHGYQFIYVRFSPRFYFAPFRKIFLSFVVQPEVSMQAMVSNTLVLLTGNRSITGMAGGSLGIQVIWGSLAVTGLVHCQYNWNFESLFVGGSIGIGLSQVIP